MIPEVSVVVPMRNEAASVDELHRELTAALDGFGRPYEVIAVDDGSTDATYERLAAVHRQDPRWRIIRFRRNFGQTAAFAAGFAHARGRYIVTTDGDLQNDPHDIPGMIRLLEARGADLVAGWRKDRKDPFLNRRLPSMIANWVISQATGVKLHDYGCSLKVFRSEVIKPMKLYGEMHRFLPAIASEFGVRIEEQEVRHHARRHGKSNYGISRAIRVVLDLLTVKFLISYSTRPLQIFGVLGIGMGLLGAAVMAWLAYVKYFHHEGIADRPLLLFGILLVFTGVQLITLGLLAEMQARTYHESQDKPIYVIRDVLEQVQGSGFKVQGSGSEFTVQGSGSELTVQGSVAENAVRAEAKVRGSLR
jgi:glycosyltransferase involved in cell wall biosynthesis